MSLPEVSKASNEVSHPSKSIAGDDKLQFEETTNFSDPLPTKGFTSASASDLDEEGDQLKKNPFLDPDVSEHWTAVYEKADYECRHIFDPALTWTDEEEKKIVRRLDWHVCLWAVSHILSRSQQSPKMKTVRHVLWFANRSWESCTSRLR